MLPYLLLGVILLLVLFMAVQWMARADTKTLLLVIKWIGGSVFALLALYLVISGRVTQLIVFAAFLPMLWRRLRGIGRGRPSPGRTSSVRTDTLDMVLDHDTGEMTGSVIAGRFAGRRLEELDLDALLDLFEECLAADEKGAQVLEAYLDRSRHGDWRDAMDGRKPSARSRGGAMTAEEARDILGLGADAGADDIKAAHREMMQRNHPDHGGSTYLAAKINQAKEILLGS